MQPRTWHKGENDMTHAEIKRQLIEYMEGLTIIDTHEHFAPEIHHLNINYNFFHWFIPYLQFDLHSAGMPKEWLWKAPTSDEEVEAYWEVIGPLMKHVKHGSYAKPIYKALKEFYDIDDINDDTYLEIGRRMNATKVKGYYDEVLRKKCGIEIMLNQVGAAKIDDPLMLGSFSVAEYHYAPAVRAFLGENPDGDLDMYIQTIKDKMDLAEKEGAVLSKFTTSAFQFALDESLANEEFNRFKTDENHTSCQGFQAYLCDEVLKHMADKDMIAAVHCGVWGNLNEQNPLYLFPLVERHPEVVFDIYHMGMPNVRETAFLGKNYQNVYLNLCWSHIVSSEMTIQALNEWIDLVPANKIFGFGGDHATNPENIWAHLMIARDNFAEVFAGRILRGLIDIEGAKEILKGWLYDNPKRVYRLDRFYE